jgi:hypothetical protein
MSIVKNPQSWFKGSNPTPRAIRDPPYKIKCYYLAAVVHMPKPVQHAETGRINGHSRAIYITKASVASAESPGVYVR